MFRRIAAIVSGLLACAAMCAAEVRLGHADALKNALRHPTPEYSSVAKQMRIQGEVEVEVRIDEAGDVADVRVVTGNPVLSGPVVRTVKDWKFTPFTDGGKSTTALATLRFSFKP